ncbi:hypothetical protein ACLOJK_010782 [Asimina triloba]
MNHVRTDEIGTGLFCTGELHGRSSFPGFRAVVPPPWSSCPSLVLSALLGGGFVDKLRKEGIFFPHLLCDFVSDLRGRLDSDSAGLKEAVDCAENEEDGGEVYAGDEEDDGEDLLGFFGCTRKRMTTVVAALVSSERQNGCIFAALFVSFSRGRVDDLVWRWRVWRRGDEAVPASSVDHRMDSRWWLNESAALVAARCAAVAPGLGRKMHQIWCFGGAPKRVQM